MYCITNISTHVKCSRLNILPHFMYCSNNISTHVSCYGLNVLLFWQVRSIKMHLFTVIQVALLALMFGLKLSPAAIAFPLFIILLIPVRLRVMNYLFSGEELKEVRILYRSRVLLYLTVALDSKQNNWRSLINGFVLRHTSEGFIICYLLL